MKKKSTDLSDSISNSNPKRRKNQLLTADVSKDSEEVATVSADPFVLKFEREFPDAFFDSALAATKQETVPGIGACIVKCSLGQQKSIAASVSRRPLEHLHRVLEKNLGYATKSLLSSTMDEVLAFSENGLLSHLLGYADLYYPGESFENAEELRLIYSAHVLNHILKTREKVIKNSVKLRDGQIDKEHNEVRDQGLTRPKVLILVPFKSSAYRIVHTFSTLLFGENSEVIMNKVRFEEEYGTPAEKRTRRVPAPVDYSQLFDGNTDDCFRIGIGITKKSLKLYVNFFKADILIASPLGLRMTAGEEKETNYDFLSSIEVCLLDQTEVFLMQNWSHVIQVLQSLNKQPKESHDVDFSRVRMWALNGLSKFYCQTILLSSVSTPELNSVLRQFSQNWLGGLSVCYLPDAGTVSQVVHSMSQTFLRFPCASPVEEADARFTAFVSKVLPKMRTGTMSHTLVYVASYFDFVRLRNFFKKEEVSFVQVSEYTTEDKVSRARDMFYHGWKHFMLFTERYHYYHRYKLRGMHNIVFYQLPTFPHFYSELCNMVQTDSDTSNNNANFILYCKYDALRMAGILGSQAAVKLINAESSLHTLCTR